MARTGMYRSAAFWEYIHRSVEWTHVIPSDSDTLELECDELAPARARQYLRSWNERHAFARFDDAELLLSEVVTNAQRHGEPPLTVEIKTYDGCGIKVCVHDGSHHVPVKTVGTLWDESGRGLEMINTLSDAWGVDPEPDAGKIVWFCLKT